MSKQLLKKLEDRARHHEERAAHYRAAVDAVRDVLGPELAAEADRIMATVGEKVEKILAPPDPPDAPTPAKRKAGRPKKPEPAANAYQEKQAQKAAGTRPTDVITRVFTSYPGDVPLSLDTVIEAAKAEGFDFGDKYPKQVFGLALRGMTARKQLKALKEGWLPTAALLRAAEQGVNGHGA